MSSKSANYLYAAKPPPNINFAAQPMASVLKASLQQQSAPRPAAPAFPLKYAVVAAPTVATPTTATAPVISIPLSAPHPPPPPSTAPAIATQLTPITQHSQEQSAVTSSPSLTQFSITSPILSSAASASHQMDSSFSGQESPEVLEAKVLHSPSVRKGVLNSVCLLNLSNLIFN